MIRPASMLDLSYPLPKKQKHLQPADTIPYIPSEIIYKILFSSIEKLLIKKKAATQKMPPYKKGIEKKIARCIYPFALANKEWKRHVDNIIVYCLNQGMQPLYFFNGKSEKTLQFFKENTHMLKVLNGCSHRMWQNFTRTEIQALISPQAQVINFTGMKVSNNTFSKLSKYYPQVKFIRIPQKILSPRGLRSLGKRFNRLTSLNVGCSMEADIFFKNLNCHFPHVHTLSLCGQRVTNTWLEKTSLQLEKIKTFKASSCNLQPNSLGRILQMFPNLTHLNLTRNLSFNCQGLEKSVVYPKLLSLEIEKTQVKKEDIKKIVACFPNLQILKAPLGNMALKRVCCSLIHLKELKASPSSISDIGLVHPILEAKNLEKLSISEGPYLKGLTNVSLTFLAAKAHPSLKSIALCGTIEVTKVWIKFLKAHFPHMPKIYLN